MSAAESVIETHGLTKRFGSRTVVKDVELRVPRGVAFGYLGPIDSELRVKLDRVTGTLVRLVDGPR